MPTRTLTIIRAAFLDLDEIALGSLVPDPREPGVNFCPDKKLSFLPEEVSSHYVENLRQLLADKKHRGIQSKLSRFFVGDINSDGRSKIEINALKSTVYYLKHPDSHFTRLINDDTTKRWIERTLKKKPIFLVSGFVTVTQANVEYGQQKYRNLNVSAEIPVTDILSHGATMLTPGEKIDISAGASVGDHTKSVSAFIAPGERVIGIQYRKVQFQWFSADINEATLKENQWKMFLGTRGQRDMIAEAHLCESMELEDLELDSFVAFDEDFVFI